MSKVSDFDDLDDELLIAIGEEKYHLWNSKRDDKDAKDDVLCIIPDDIGAVIKDYLRSPEPIKRITQNKLYKHMGGDAHAFLTVSEDHSGNASSASLLLLVDKRQYYITIKDDDMRMVSNSDAMGSSSAVKGSDMMIAGEVMLDYGLENYFPDSIFNLIGDRI